jgi:hypothetical protein
MASRIQLRRGTAAEWTSSNPTLAQGEMGVETDTGKFKIGNGTTAWSTLSYVSTQGVQGIQGTGTQGIQGLQGSDATVQGIQGLQGADGLQGDTGTTPAISIPGPYNNDLNAELNGVAIGSMYYQPGGAVFVRLE